jgi:hypothetical protein
MLGCSDARMLDKTPIAVQRLDHRFVERRTGHQGRHPERKRAVGYLGDDRA